MANRRMISKSISTSKKLSTVSTLSALLFTWLVPHCDDNGNMDGDPKVVKGIVLPLRSETVEDVAAAINELKSVKLADVYKVAGEQFIHINQWNMHQTLRGDRPDIRFPVGKPKVNRGFAGGKRNGTERNGTELNGTATIKKEIDDIGRRKEF